MIWYVSAVNVNENKAWEETFEGGEPPEKVGLGIDEEGRTGSEPVDECIDWILANCKQGG